MNWHSSFTRPPRPDVYRVQVPFPALGERKRIDERFARWTGYQWCCWATTPEAAAQCDFKGPSAGYLWAELVA